MTQLNSGQEGEHPDRLFQRLADLLKGGREAAGLARYLEANFSDFGALLCAPVSVWDNVALAGEQFPVMLQVLRECAFRHNRACLPTGDVSSDERKLLDYLIVRLGWEEVEIFYILFLDAKNRLIADEIQGVGTVNHAPVYPREIARKCLMFKAAGVIMAHNHPSGDATPSAADVVMTQKVEAALGVLNVKLLDHYVIGRGCQSSFRQLGLL